MVIVWVDDNVQQVILLSLDGNAVPKLEVVMPYEGSCDRHTAYCLNPKHLAHH